MTIGKLKQILENAISNFDLYDDDEEIVLDSDTYNLVQRKDAKNLLCVVGYDGGYADLDNIQTVESIGDEND